MSTNDVPGANPRNNDELRMGCWAEHSDGSLILVESTEDNQVVFVMFDMSDPAPVEYRDAMLIGDFGRMFSCDPSDIGKKVSDSKGRTIDKDIWTWHDKTPFPFARVMQKGIKPGLRHASRQHLAEAAERVEESAAKRVRDALHMDAEPLKDRSHMEDVIRSAVPFMKAIMNALGNMRK